MTRKLILICSAAAAVFVAVALYFLSEREISSTSSSGSRYTVQITQERPLPGTERYVYLNASRGGEPFLKRKLLYTGDFLDSEFKELYPNNYWSSESILKIGQAQGEETDGLRISNETSRRLKYLLIETYGDKFVLFDVEPGAVVNLPFIYSGRLSCQGEFSESGARFGDAVEVANGGANVDGRRFLISVRENRVSIESPQQQISHVTCCAVDRPDFNHE